jgi:hypothetical protein
MTTFGRYKRGFMLTDLNAALDFVTSAPKTDSVIDILCARPARGLRQFPDILTLCPQKGVLGDRWFDSAWLTLPDGRPDPRIQVSILPKRVLDLVWQDRENTIHPGDQIITDLDTSVENLPIGTRIAAGTAILQVSDVPNLGCAKWKVRYGANALSWAMSHPELRLRGVLCAIVQDGVLRKTDRLRVLG